MLDISGLLAGPPETNLLRVDVVSVMSAGRSDEGPDRIDAPRPTVGLLRRWAAVRARKTCLEPAKHAERQSSQLETFSLQKRTDSTKDSLVTDPATDLALKSLCFGRRGVKKQGVSGPKNGRLFSSVSTVRFKKTTNPAVPQNRSGLCSRCGTMANRALPSGTAQPYAGLGGMRLSVVAVTSASGKATQSTAAEFC